MDRWPPGTPDPHRVWENSHANGVVLHELIEVLGERDPALFALLRDRLKLFVIEYSHIPQPGIAERLQDRVRWLDDRARG